ncbi:MAG: TonB-dependent receptor, partial [Acidobacteriota bacterium]|nr:TonB-dependent receptor [Acidobacteriota bacterium]
GVDQMRPYPYIKLTYQPNQDNKLVLTYRYSDIIRHHRGASRYMLEETTWEQKTATHVMSLDYTRFFGSNFFMDIKGFAYLSQFDLLAKNDSPRFVEYTTSRSSGSYGYDDLNPRDRYSAQVRGTLFLDNLLGNHEIKGGVEYVEGVGGRDMVWRDHPENPFRDDGYYLYYVYTYGGEPWRGYWYAPYKVEERSRNLGVFLQDAWAPTKRLTFNLGLRYEMMKGIIPPQMEDEGEKTLPLPEPYNYTYNRAVTETITTYTWHTLSPRLGLVFDLTGDGKTTFKASFSRYYLANLTQWISRGNPNGFVSFSGIIDEDYNLLTLTGLGLAGPEYVPRYGYEDFKFKTPYTDEFVIGIERELVRDTSFGVRYIRKWSRNNIEDADADYLNLGKLLSTGEYEWYNYEPVTVTDPYDDSPQTFYNRTAISPGDWYMINPPDANRDYDGVEVTLNKRYSNGWQMQASYVYQKSRGLIATDFNETWSGTTYYDNPNAHINAIGRFPDERTHQIKLQGMVQLPWGITLGGYTRFLSGRRYTRQIRSTDILGADDDLNQGTVTIYAEERGSRQLPEVAILDLRLEKKFRISRTSLGIFVDIFNVFNDNKATGVYAISGHPTIEFESMQSIMDPRIIRIGARFEW